MAVFTENAFFSPSGLRLVTTRSPVGTDRGFLAMDNVWFCRDQPDAIEPVPGFSAVNSDEISFAGSGLTLRNIHFAYKSDGTRMIIVMGAGVSGGGGPAPAASEGGLYTITTAGVASRVYSGYTADTIVSMAQLNDLVFFANGVDTVVDATIHETAPTVTDSGLTRLDVSSATSAINASDVNAVRGTVKYFVAPFDENSIQHGRPDGGELDQSDGWTNSSGSSNANLYVDIDEETQANSDYVQTVAMSPVGSTARYFELSDTTDPTTSTDHIVRYAYRSETSNSDMSLAVSLVQDWDASVAGPTTHASWNYSSIPSTYTTSEETLSGAEANAITDYTDLSLHFNFTNNVTSGVKNYYPLSDVTGATVGTWSPGTPFWDDLDADDANTQTNTSAAAGDQIRCRISSEIIDPESSSQHAIKIKCKVSAGSSGALDLTLRQGTTLIVTKSFTGIDTTDTVYTHPLTGAQADSITDYTKLNLTATTVSAEEFVINQMWVDIPAGNESAYLSWAEFEVPFVTGAASLSEGPISSAFGEIDAKDGNTIDLAAVPLGSTGKVRLYRTYANGTNPFYVTSLTGAAGATTTHTDDLPDNLLGDPPYNHGDPPLATYNGCIAYANRLWFFRKGTSIVDYSDLAEPESYWNNTSVGGNFIEVFGNDGDVVTALAAATDGVIVFKRNHIYKIRGTGPEDFFVQQLTLSNSEVRSVGTVSTQSLVSTPGALYFYWNKDFWEYDGVSLTRISKDIHEDLDAITESAEALHVAVGFWHAERIVMFSVPLSDTTQPTHTYMYDIVERRFVGRLTEGFRGFSTIEDSSGNTEFWGLEGDVNVGYVYKFDSGTTFNSTNIASTLTLPSFYGHDVTQQKRFLYVDIYFEPTTNSGENVDVVYEIDGISGSTTTVSLPTEDADNNRNKRRINIGYIGRELRITVSGDGGSTEPPTWKIYGWNYGYQRLTGVSN